MDDNKNYNDFFMLLILGITVLLFLLMTVWFKHLAGFWYYLNFPVMKLIQYIPKEVFDYGYIWVFWEDNFSNNIKGATNFILNEGVANLKDENYINGKLESFGFNQKEFILFYNNLLAIFYSPFVFYYLYIIKKRIEAKERFNKVYDNKSISEQEADIWIPIKPVVYEFDKMIQGSPYDQKNWWAGAETPLKYLEKRGVLIKFKKEEDDEFEKKPEFIKLDVKKLYNIFIDEIGEPWKGIEHLNFEERAVFAIILPKLFKDNKSSKKLRDIMARAYASLPQKDATKKILTKKQLKLLFTFKWNKLKFKEKVRYRKARKKIIQDKNSARKEIEPTINSIINKYYYEKPKKQKGFFKKNKKEPKKIRKEVLDIINKHYYKNCVFIKLLDEGRATSGVLASCEMIWVKIENRPFWYVLSQTGRAAAFPEVSGLWSHYLAENKVNRRMAAPRVENAILAADKYMFYTHNNYEPFNELQDD